MSYVIRTEVDISASREGVGDVLVDFPRYGEWSTFSRVDGTTQVGNRLSIKMPGLSFRPTVTVAEPRVQLQWSGTLLSERLFIGRHLFVLSPNPDGTTHLTNHEEFSGAVTTLSQRFHEAGRQQRLHSLQRWSQAAGGRPRHAADPHLKSPPHRCEKDLEEEPAGNDRRRSGLTSTSERSGEPREPLPVSPASAL